MKKILITLLSMIIVLSAVGCNQTPPDVPDDTDNQPENNDLEDQLLSYDNYDEFLKDIYLCDDVYILDDTPTHGSGSILLPMAQDVLELNHYKLLLCDDGCDPTAVVSRAFWGYGPGWRIDKYEEHTTEDGWSFPTRRYINEVPDEIKAQMISQGAPESVTEPRDYIYLLTLDEQHYAYIHLKGIENTERLANESELADSIVKNARINFEPRLAVGESFN